MSDANIKISNDGKMTEECLYSPVRFFLHNIREEEENGEYGGLYDDEYEISGEEAFEHIDAIHLALQRERDYMDRTRGMAEYLPDELKGKIWSMFPYVEFQGDGIYCVAKMELTAPLTADELAKLKSDWRSELADGFGEGLEQREIKIGEEELYVVVWNSDESKFFIDTQSEFERRMGIAPPEISTAKSVGYVFAVADDSAFYIPDALHIERDDSMMIFKTDKEAAEEAKNDGVSFISGLGGVPDGVYIDTPENREIIEKWKEIVRQALPAPAEMVGQIHKRLGENYVDYRSETLELSKADIFSEAAEIADICQAYDYFRKEHNYTVGQAEFLLKFQNPLDLIYDRWSDHIGTVKETVSAIFSEQERTLNNGGYELMSDEKPSSSRTAKDLPAAAYTSVLDRIRKDKEEKRSRPPVQEDSSSRKAKNKGEEL